MLTNKKSFFVAVVCLFATVFLQAQSATADLTKRYLERANTQYESAQYLDA